MPVKKVIVKTMFSNEIITAQNGERLNILMIYKILT
jgi:hypothetical protein